MDEDPRKATPKAPTERQVNQAFTVQNIYFNGFTLGLSNADINAMLLVDGHPVGRLNMSFTTAKTLAKLLNELMDTFQSATGHDIMTTDQVAEGLQKFSEGSKS